MAETSFCSCDQEQNEIPVYDSFFDYVVDLN